MYSRLERNKMVKFTETEYEAYVGLLQLLKYQRNMEIRLREVLVENTKLKQKDNKKVT